MSQPDEDFASLFAQSETHSKSARHRPGQVVTGTIVQIGHDSVFVDIGTRSEARIDLHQLTDKDGTLRYAIGDRISATVAQGGDRPVLVVSFGGGAMDVESLRLAQESGVAVEGKVLRAIKGGIEVEIGGRRCFCPASQVDIMYTKDLSVFEGQNFSFKILEVKDGGRTIVVSRKALLEAERAVQTQERLRSLEVGAVVDGVVQSIQSYGAFIDLNGVEGMVHISELGHGRVDSVSTVLTVGETVRVQVMDVVQQLDGKGPRIRLSMKALQQAPAGESSGPAKAPEKIFEGVVTKVEPFGVFVTTEEGTGMVPVRELELAPGSDTRRAYPIGRKVSVVGMGVDGSGRRKYSMKRVEEVESRMNYRAFSEENAKRNTKSGDLGSFGELLKARLSD